MIGCLQGRLDLWIVSAPSCLQRHGGEVIVGKIALRIQLDCLSIPLARARYVAFAKLEYPHRLMRESVLGSSRSVASSKICASAVGPLYTITSARSEFVSASEAGCTAREASSSATPEFILNILKLPWLT